ncbi:cell wall-binding repeat-containing protein [Herbiconiux liukaitaii]|uniref:cell wall-binding repeat-containing protein n=1 Tax=Herbiconiux liukaitaii TaxID=3342799 RepID=UPI0035B70101
MSPYDRDGGVSIIAGALPRGVELVGSNVDRKPYLFQGVPQATGTFSFTVKAEFEDAWPKTIDCTMTVGTPGSVSRIAGADRYAQAVEVSRTFTEAETVYLASGEKFPDALSAGSVAGFNDAPLLLVSSGAVPAATLAEIDRLDPDHVVVVGGPASVSDEVLESLKREIDDASLTRIGGADRYAVSRALISDARFGIPTASTAYLATGTTFPDALSSSPAAVTAGGPVLLVNGAAPALSTEESALLTALGTKEIRIAGGTSSIGQSLETSLARSFSVSRSSGADRYEAAVAINKSAFAASPTVYLASGTAFADALSAAPVAGRDKNPVYLVQPNCVPNSVLQEIVRLEPAKIIILGGTATIGSAVETLRSC